MYDVTKLKTLEECRTVMGRARQQGLEDVYRDVFGRYCDLAGAAADDPEDPLVRDVYEMLAAYEQLLTEKNGKTTLASRTRRKIKDKGVLATLTDWTKGKTETEGFTTLVENGLSKYTGEYLVVRYRDRFEDDLVEKAKARLEEHGVDLPE